MENRSKIINGKSNKKSSQKGYAKNISKFKRFYVVYMPTTGNRDTIVIKQKTFVDTSKQGVLEQLGKKAKILSIKEVK